MDKLPLLDLDFRTTYVDNGVLYTPSKGSLVTKAVMGTGVVGNVNAPTITGIGASFDGGDYTGTQASDLFEYNLPHSIVIRARLKQQLPGVQQSIVSNYDTTPGTFTFMVSGGMLYCAMTDILGGWIAKGSGTTVPAQPTTLVTTYDGSRSNTGIDMYIGGEKQNGAPGGNSLTATIRHATPFRISGYPTGGYPLVTGSSIRCILVFPFCMTPTQVRAIHDKFEREGES